MRSSSPPIDTAACDATTQRHCRFKSMKHRMTRETEAYARDFLPYGLTVSAVSAVTGLDRKLVKEADKERIKELYTEGSVRLRRPPQARILGIDEFSLRKGHQYVVVIMDLETGHVLYLAKG